MHGALDICWDEVFKAVFATNSPISRGAIQGLLSAYLGRDLSIVSVKIVEPPLDDIRQRQLRYDISAVFDDNEQANVEMIMYPTSAEKAKIEYYLARLFTSQEIRGNDKSYKSLKPAYQLSFVVNHRLFPDEAWDHTFIYYDPERQTPFGGQTAILTVELSKTDKLVEKPVIEMTHKEMWACYFRYFTDESKAAVLQEILKREETISMAEQAVKGFTQEQLEYMQETARLGNIMYWNSLQEDREEEAEMRGEERGRKEVFALLESGKTLEEAKQILGIK
jgi:predicted transposase/invertase (TIGR01784 family)